MKVDPVVDGSVQARVAVVAERSTIRSSGRNSGDAESIQIIILYYPGWLGRPTVALRDLKCAQMMLEVGRYFRTMSGLYTHFFAIATNSNMNLSILFYRNDSVSRQRRKLKDDLCINHCCNYRRYL